mmetsp:Transcript_22933/g.79648  ORF Transcript_22933/g.79648 Transcript_22933/m.79648 type:complete len:208 (-) Transcript_22933:626-1249(-)
MTRRKVLAAVRSSFCARARGTPSRASWTRLLSSRHAPRTTSRAWTASSSQSLSRGLAAPFLESPQTLWGHFPRGMQPSASTRLGAGLSTSPEPPSCGWQAEGPRQFDGRHRRRRGDMVHHHGRPRRRPRRPAASGQVRQEDVRGVVARAGALPFGRKRLHGHCVFRHDGGVRRAGPFLGQQLEHFRRHVYAQGLGGSDGKGAPIGLD